MSTELELAKVRGTSMPNARNRLTDLNSNDDIDHAFEKIILQILAKSQDELRKRERIAPLTCLHLEIQLLQRKVESGHEPSREEILGFLDKARRLSSRIIQLSDEDSALRTQS